MYVQRQPNSWSCLPTAFAILLDVPCDKIISHTGHDGSQIIWPNLPEPKKRRGFHIQEMIAFCISQDWLVTPFEACPTSLSSPEEQPFILPERSFAIGLELMMQNSMGVLVGPGHAVSWDRGILIDPGGRYKQIEDFPIQSYWMLSSRR